MYEYGFFHKNRVSFTWIWFLSSVYSCLYTNGVSFIWIELLLYKSSFFYKNWVLFAWMKFNLFEYGIFYFEDYTLFRAISKKNTEIIYLLISCQECNVNLEIFGKVGFLLSHHFLFLKNVEFMMLLRISLIQETIWYESSATI